MIPGNNTAARRTGLFFLSLALVLFGVHAWLLRHFTVDDAFITFRYARNLAAGLGPVFNPGEAVEGYSNPLYTGLLAGLAALTGPQSLPLAGRIIGILAAAGSLILVATLPTVSLAPASLLAACLTAISTSFALWAVGGLETSLYGFLILAGVTATLKRPAGTSGQIATGLALAGITLSRPEGVLPALVLYAVRWVDPETRRDWKGHLRIGLAAGVPVFGYVLFRVVYFGDWLPNTYYAKQKELGPAIRRGWHYLVSFIHENGRRWLYLGALFAFLPLPGRRAVIVSAAVLFSGLFFIVMFGGDWMDHHRFLAPFVPLVYLLVARGWDSIFSPIFRLVERRRGGRVAAYARVAVLGLVWATLLRATAPDSLAHRTVAYVNATPYYATIGKLVGVAADPDWTVALHDIGAVGWYGRTRVLDLLGLVEPRRARRRIQEDAMIAQARPEIIILHYDNHHPPKAPWQLPDLPDFETEYPVPRSPVPLPECFRVRVDLLPHVQPRLAGMTELMRAEVTVMNQYLISRRPDGKVWEPVAR